MTLRNWKLKGVIQKVLSLVPGGGRLNNSLQSALGGLKDFEGNIAAKVDDWQLMLQYLRQADRGVGGQVLLEVGTGWYPTLPVCHILGGARNVYTVDIVQHADEELTFRMLRALEGSLETIAGASGRALGAVREHYAALRRATTWTELLAASGIEYRAPEDASKLNLPDRSIDILYSNSVLEHVTPSLIGPIMREAHRVLKDDGLAVHAVACNDHYAYFDKSISFVNFLRYSDKEWRFWNNSLNYQSRLRAIDYTRMTQEAGFRIAWEVRAVRPGSREALQAMTVAPEFRHYDTEDLVATTVDFVAVKQ
jgi:SAM-dependent methyltransferase